jgi:hypothetical protein
MLTRNKVKSKFLIIIVDLHLKLKKAINSLFKQKSKI